MAAAAQRFSEEYADPMQDPWAKFIVDRVSALRVFMRDGYELVNSSKGDLPIHAGILSILMAGHPTFSNSLDLGSRLIIGLSSRELEVLDFELVVRSRDKHASEFQRALVPTPRSSELTARMCCEATIDIVYALARVGTQLAIIDETPFEKGLRRFVCDIAATSRFVIDLDTATRVGHFLKSGNAYSTFVMTSGQRLVPNPALPLPVRQAY